MKYLRIAWAFLVRDFLLVISYRTAFVLDFAWIALVVPVLSLLGLGAGGAASPSLQAYGGNYFAFLLIGVAFQDYVTFSQTNFNQSVREHQLMGTLEIVMLSPTPVPVVLLASSLWGYIYTTLRFVVYLLIGTLFGLDLSNVNWMSTLLVTALSVTCFSAVGILTASLVVLLQRGAEGVTRILTALSVALSGVLYPVTSLPGWLQGVSSVLPFTHSLEGMRRALLGGASPVELTYSLTTLALFTAALFPVGLWMFSLAVLRSKRTGTLGTY
jgi:ABC-2 type transport system permease protein